MAVGFVNSVELFDASAGTTDMSVSYTVGAGSNRLLLVFVAFEEDSPIRAITEVTVDGDSIFANEEAGIDTTGGLFTETHRVYSMKEADLPTGTVTVAVTLGAGNNDAYMVVAMFDGVDQTTPVSYNNEQELDATDSTDYTLTATTSADDMAVNFHTFMSFSAGQTQYNSPTTIENYDTGGGGSSGMTAWAVYKLATGGSVTLGAQHNYGSNRRMNQTILTLAQVSAGGGGGRIMSSLAHYGGLAGTGGIAGSGGGLAG